MFTRCTFLFNLTTEPDDRASASPRTGGWSEGFWVGSQMNSDDVRINQLATKRALLLGKQASIVGYRLANYEASGNKLIPKGTSTGRFLYPGRAGSETDVPQMALMMSATATGKPNSSRFSIRGIPDGQVTKGEYQPDTTFKTAMTNFCTELANVGWGFIGRDLETGIQPVRGIANGKLNTADVPGVVVGTSYVRLLKVRDVDGEPVIGSFRVTASVGPEYTLQGLDAGITALAVGASRLDQLVFCDFATVKPDSICVRKIGRPGRGYRGRASKR